MTLLFDSVVIPEVAVQDSDLRFPVRRIYCVGQNYRDHVKEMGGDPKSSAPVFFSKPADAVVPSGSRIAYPSATGNLHYEVELVVALKSGGSELDADRALECIYGYAVGIDFTRRDLQAQAKQKGRPWDTAKGFDASVRVRADARFEDVVAHLSKLIKRERAFAYLGAAFTPSYDARVGALCDGYGERNDEGGRLVVFYSTTPAWG